MGSLCSRPVPPVTPAKLERAQRSVGGGLAVVALDFDDEAVTTRVCNYLADTFLSEAMMGWVHEGLSDEQQKEGVAYMMTWVSLPAFRKGVGFALVRSDPGVAAPGGHRSAEWLAVAVCYPPGESMTTLDAVRSGIQMGKPPQFAFGEESKRRLQALSAISEARAEYGENRKFWYLQNIAAAPKGQGHGKTMMRFLTSLAHNDGVPLYLESGPANVPFYVGKCDMAEVRTVAVKGEASVALEMHLLHAPPPVV